MMRIERRVLLASLAAVAATWPFRQVPSAPTVGRIEPPPPVGPTPRYVNIFNRVGRSLAEGPRRGDGRERGEEHTPPDPHHRTAS